MPRPPRAAEGGLNYHALNRATARLTLFDSDEDYTAFERVLAQAVPRHDMRLLAYCLTPDHFHLLLWPRADGDLSRFLRWLTMTHTQRRHAHHRTAGTGHLYQGRFKSFPVQADEHFRKRSVNCIFKGQRHLGRMGRSDPSHREPISWPSPPEPSTGPLEGVAC
jgi:putative transposase